MLSTAARAFPGSGPTEVRGGAGARGVGSAVNQRPKLERAGGGIHRLEYPVGINQEGMFLLPSRLGVFTPLQGG